MAIDPQTPEACRRALPPGAHIGVRRLRDGWPIRTLTWSAPEGKNRGSLLFMGGRGDHIEKYYEVFANWRADGWQVESFDWRGQGKSGRNSQEKNIGHIDDFGIWIDDLQEIVADWTARTPGPHVLIGHSMGGHLLARALGEHKVKPDAAVLSAPMLGFAAPLPNRMGGWVARLMCWIGRPDRAAWRTSEKPGSNLHERQAMLTHDVGRYADEQWWRARDPELNLGPASWGWMRAAYRSFAVLDTPGLLEGIALPVLTLMSPVDRLVSAKAIRRLTARIPDGQIHAYGKDCAHEVLREVDAIRNDALARISAFLPARTD